MSTFTRAVDLLHRGMDVNTLRYQVSANNMAASGVPNFKRSVVNFESELKRAFESEEKAKNGFQLTMNSNAPSGKRAATKCFLPAISIRRESSFR